MKWVERLLKIRQMLTELKEEMNWGSHFAFSFLAGRRKHSR
jgi:hypothetical protein